MKKILLTILLYFCMGNAYSSIGSKLSDKVTNIKLAAAQGDAEAQAGLGVLYYTGQGVTQDYNQAAKWFKKAADQGRAQGQYNLGVSYSKGRGVSQDYKRAMKWFKKAAN